MASASITRRRTSSGPRYVVRYRLGGRAYPIRHAGSFTRERDARTRRDFVAGELSAGRDPALSLRTLAEAPVHLTLLQRFDDPDPSQGFMASRVDVGNKAQALYRNARDRLRSLASLEPHEVTVAHVQGWIAENSVASKDFSALSPKSLGHYLSTLRQVLDFCDVTPNPARSPKVKLPEQIKEEIAPPDSTEWVGIKRTLTPRLALVTRFIECEAVRVSEALDLTYGDVDFAGGRVRISRARTKGRTAGQRWLPVPPELLDEIGELVPLEDRHRDRLVFPRLTDNQVRDHLSRACRNAGIAHYHPHDLRHRRISLWFAEGFDPQRVKTWAGHARASMSLDVYAHVVIDPAADEWRGFWRAAYAAGRSHGVVSVWSEDDETDREPASRANASLQET
jgi:integrase